MENKDDDESAAQKFAKLMEEAWTFTQSTIESILEDLEKSKEKSDEKIEVKVPEVGILPEKDEELFIGFGTQESNSGIGSARINFLRTLCKHSSEHRDLAISFRRGNNDFLRAMWRKDYLASESRLDARSTGTESGQFDCPPQEIDFDSTPTVMTTRSRGRPMKIDNVQPRTLEYKRYEKK